MGFTGKPQKVVGEDRPAEDRLFLLFKALKPRSSKWLNVLQLHPASVIGFGFKLFSRRTTNPPIVADGGFMCGFIYSKGFEV